MKTIRTAQYAQNTGLSQRVDMNQRGISNPVLKRQLQKIVADILKPNFFDKIPLQQISDAFKSLNVRMLQEDGSDWSGLLLGGKDCGDPRASDQRVTIPLAYAGQMLKAYLILSWCRMPSGKTEVTGYIS